MIEKKEYFLIPFLLFGLILIGFGFYLMITDFIFYFKYDFFNFNWNALIPIILGISIFLFKGGFRYYTNERIVEKFVEFFGLNLWRSKIYLPDTIESVQIIRRKITRAYYINLVQSIKSKDIICDVYLIQKNSKYIKKLFSVGEKQAIEYGKIIADSYNVELINKK